MNNLFSKIHLFLDPFLCRIVYLTSGKYEYYRTENGLKILMRVGSSDKFAVWEVWKSKVYDKFDVNQRSVIVDIGAHIGSFTLWASKKYNAPKIYSYEPDNNNYAILKKNIEINNLKGIEIINKAVADESKSIKYYAGDNGAMNSLYNKRKGKALLVKSVGIIEIINYAGGKVNLLKLDCEGAEYEIIEKLCKSKKIKRIEKIVMEYHEGYRKGFNKEFLMKLLEENAFDVKIEGNYFMRRVTGTGYLIAANRNWN